MRLGRSHGVLLPYGAEGGADPAPERDSVISKGSILCLSDATMFWLWLHPSSPLPHHLGIKTRYGHRRRSEGWWRCFSRRHTCFAVLPPFSGPSLSGHYANLGRGITQTEVGILLPCPMEGWSTAKQVWSLPWTPWESRHQPSSAPPESSPSLFS